MNEEERAEDRPARVVAAAEQRHGDDGDRDHRIEHLADDEVGGAQGHDRADHPGDRRREHEGEQLVADHRHAERLGRLLVLAQRAQAVTEARAADDDEQQGRGGGEREHGEVDDDQVGRAEQDAARGAARRLGGEDAVLHQLGNAEGEDHEVGSAHAQHRQADQRREQRGQGAGGDDRQRQRPDLPGDDDEVGAQAVEHDVAERDIAGQLREQAPALGQRQPHEQRQTDRDQIGVGEEGQRRQCRRGDDAGARPAACRSRRHDAHAALARRANRPLGNSSKAATKAP